MKRGLRRGHYGEEGTMERALRGYYRALRRKQYEEGAKKRIL